MNFVEIMELERVVSAFQTKFLAETPKIHVYDTQNEGYVLCIKKDLVKSGYLSFLEKVATTRGLRIRQLRGYFILCTP
jgi:hypothetical protein